MAVIDYMYKTHKDYVDTFKSRYFTNVKGNSYD